MKPSSNDGRGVPGIQSNGVGDGARTAAELLRDKELIHRFGNHGEYEVRTRIDTRQAWRYRCSVFRRGKELKREFPRIEVDLTDQMRTRALITEETRVAFAMNAAMDHLSRCAAVQEYLLLAAIHLEALQRHRRRRYAVWAGPLCVGLLMAFWFWGDPSALHLLRSFAQSPPPMVRWRQNVVFYEHPSGEWFAFRLPALDRTPRRLPVEVRLEAPAEMLGWLHFDREIMVISGMAPSTAQDRTYQLIFHARAEDGPESFLRAYVTITGQMTLLAPSPPSPKPAPAERSPPKDCLLHILKGEPCADRF